MTMASGVSAMEAEKPVELGTELGAIVAERKKPPGDQDGLHGDDCAGVQIEKAVGDDDNMNGRVDEGGTRSGEDGRQIGAEQSSPGGAEEGRKQDGAVEVEGRNTAGADQGEETPAEDGTASAAPLDRAKALLGRGDCPLKEEYCSRVAQTAEDVLQSLTESKVEIVRKPKEIEEDRNLWYEAHKKMETNFLGQDLPKQLRKREVVFERFNRYEKEGPLEPEVTRQVDIRGKVMLAPLTTVGNLPFRRLCKRLGADVTIGEMAVSEHILKGFKDEWALLRRHESEDVFGVQLAGSYSDVIAKAAELISTHCDVDFIDLNVGCPIDMVCKKGAGCALLRRPDRLRGIVRKGSAMSSLPFSVKLRTGIHLNPNDWNAHKIIPKLPGWGAKWITMHGRSKEQRYRRVADWQYIKRCAKLANEAGVPMVGNGDIFSYEDAEDAFNACDAIMVARGALIKPWIFQEIKEQRYIDITPTQRLELYREFVGYGLDHYGADSRGRETTRRFLLEWLCFTCRYPPVGLFERVGERLDELRPRMNYRIPTAVGRDRLEMTLSSRDPQDWVRISELLLGPVPDNFGFRPKHVSNAWSEAGMAFQ